MYRLDKRREESKQLLVEWWAGKLREKPVDRWILDVLDKLAFEDNIPAGWQNHIKFMQDNE